MSMEQPAQLLCYTLAGQRYGLPCGGGMFTRIGSGADCEIQISAPSVRPMHYRLDWLGGAQFRVSGMAPDVRVMDGGPPVPSREFTAPFTLEVGGQAVHFTLELWTAAQPGVLAETPAEPHGPSVRAAVKDATPSRSFLLPPVPDRPAVHLPPVPDRGLQLWLARSHQGLRVFARRLPHPEAAPFIVLALVGVLVFCGVSWFAYDRLVRQPREEQRRAEVASAESQRIKEEQQRESERREAEAKIAQAQAEAGRALAEKARAEAEAAEAPRKADMAEKNRLAAEEAKKSEETRRQEEERRRKAAEAALAAPMPAVVHPLPKSPPQPPMEAAPPAFPEVVLLVRAAVEVPGIEKLDEAMAAYAAEVRYHGDGVLDRDSIRTEKLKQALRGTSPKILSPVQVTEQKDGSVHAECTTDRPPGGAPADGAAATFQLLMVLRRDNGRWQIIEERDATAKPRAEPMAAAPAPPDRGLGGTHWLLTVNAAGGINTFRITLRADGRVVTQGAVAANGQQVASDPQDRWSFTQGRMRIFLAPTIDLIGMESRPGVIAGTGTSRRSGGQITWRMERLR